MTKSKFWQMCLLTASMLLASAAFANVVGTVIFKAGDASITHEDKSVIVAEKNTALNSGDTIETREGRLQFSLIDGGKVSLQPNSIFKINKYEFSGKEDGSEYAFTELIKGGLRTITGLIGHKNRERYQLKTAVATIGIRGTEFTLNFNDNQFLMTTNHGSVDVCAQTGVCLNAVTGQTIVVSGAGGAPKFSSKAAKAAAAAPSGGGATYSSSDTITADGLPNVIAGATPDISKLTSGNVLSLISDSGNGVLENFSSTSVQITKNGNLTHVGPSSTGFEVSPITFSSLNTIKTDGIITWGQATSGTYSNPNTNDFNDTLQVFDYIAGATPNPANLATLSGRYNVFASSAPFLVVNGASTTSIGLANQVGGYLDFNFSTLSHSFQLTIPTNTQTFTLNGSGSLVAGTPDFSGTGTVSSNICGCTSFGSALNGGKLIQGSFFGINGERVGLQYGLSLTAGVNIYGGAVLK